MTVPCTHVMCTFRFLRIPLRANLPAHSGVQKREYRTFPKKDFEQGPIQCTVRTIFSSLLSTTCLLTQAPGSAGR